MGDTIKQSGDILIVTGRCSSCGARVAGAIIGAKTDCCATGRLMAWQCSARRERALPTRIRTRHPAAPVINERLGVLIVRVVRVLRYHVGLAPQRPSRAEQTARITFYPAEQRRMRKRERRDSVTDADFGSAASTSLKPPRGR